MPFPSPRHTLKARRGLAARGAEHVRVRVPREERDQEDAPCEAEGERDRGVVEPRPPGRGGVRVPAPRGGRPADVPVRGRGDRLAVHRDPPEVEARPRRQSRVEGGRRGGRVRVHPRARGHLEGARGGVGEVERVHRVQQRLVQARKEEPTAGSADRPRVRDEAACGRVRVRPRCVAVDAPRRELRGPLGDPPPRAEGPGRAREEGPRAPSR